MKKYIIILVLLAGCTDADKAHYGSFGSKATITCYSGDIIIFKAESTGKVNSTGSGSGWEFKDNKTNKFVRISGNCIIEQE